MTNTTQYIKQKSTCNIGNSGCGFCVRHYNNTFTRAFKKQKQIGMRLNLKNKQNSKLSVFFLIIIFYNNLPPTMSWIPLKHL